ncbi:MAG TPA: DUF559 domain-containing protein [Polyangiaceae bacterium]|nr:DUF559 domain-containing protein [Polyangiaceae bacterium]
MSRSTSSPTRARLMRASPTPSEAQLWRALRGAQLGVAFRRQVVINGFIVDFAAPQARLVVEVDGGCHRAPRGISRCGPDRPLRPRAARLVV